MPSQSQSLRTKLKFKEKLIVKGAGASTDVLLKKLKVSPPFFFGRRHHVEMHAARRECMLLDWRMDVWE